MLSDFRQRSACPFTLGDQWYLTRRGLIIAPYDPPQARFLAAYVVDELKMRKPSTGEIAGPGLRRADDVRMEYANESLTGSAELTPQSTQIAVIKLKEPS